MCLNPTRTPPTPHDRPSAHTVRKSDKKLTASYWLYRKGGSFLSPTKQLVCRACTGHLWTCIQLGWAPRNEEHLSEGHVFLGNSFWTMLDSSCCVFPIQKLKQNAHGGLPPRDFVACIASRQHSVTHIQKKYPDKNDIYCKPGSIFSSKYVNQDMCKKRVFYYV